MKHWMQMPLQPGQVRPGGAWLTTHWPDPEQIPATSTSWQRSSWISVTQVTLGVGRQLPPEQVPAGHSAELVVQALPEVAL